MSSLLPKLIKSYHPLLYTGDNLYASRGSKIYKLSTDLKSKSVVGTYNNGFLENILCNISIYNRIFRKGFHALASNEEGDLVAIVKSHILYKSVIDKAFSKVFNDFRGSRPLRLEYTQGIFAFGEYFGNPDRKSVNIYTSRNGYDWEKTYTFPENTIRHVHGILDDPDRKGSWIFTGDDDNESKVWFSDDKFETLKPIVEGSQAARAVNIITLKEKLIVPTDTPREQNYIQSYSFKTDQLKKLVKIPGSAFHAIESDGIKLVSTVTEPSEINKTDAATLWGSLDGENWKCICELKKDIFPINLQHIFRYAEIALTPGLNKSPYITAYGRALKGRDNCMLVWEKEELRRFLR